MTQLAGAERDQPQRPEATRHQHQHQGSEQDAHRDPGDQHRQRVGVREHPTARRSPERLDRPTVVQHGRRGLRAAGSLSGAEHRVRRTGVIVERHRGIGMALQRARQHRPRHHRHAHPPQERASARRHRRREHPLAVDRDEDRQQRELPGLDREIRALPRVASTSAPLPRPDRAHRSHSPRETRQRSSATETRPTGSKTRACPMAPPETRPCAERRPGGLPGRACRKRRQLGPPERSLSDRSPATRGNAPAHAPTAPTRQTGPARRRDLR